MAKEMLIKIIKRTAGKFYTCDAKGCDHQIEKGETYCRVSVRTSIGGGAESTTKTLCHRHSVKPSVRVVSEGNQ